MNATSTAQACVMRAKSTCSAEVLSTGSAQSSHGMTPGGPGRHMPYEWCTFGRAGSPASGLLALLISVALLAEAAAGLRAGAAPGDSGARAASTSSRLGRRCHHAAEEESRSRLSHALAGGRCTVNRPIFMRAIWTFPDLGTVRWIVLPWTTRQSSLCEQMTAGALAGAR